MDDLKRLAQLAQLALDPTFVGRVDAAKEVVAAVPALIARVKAAEGVLKQLSAPHGCGCKPCTGQCRSAEALWGQIEEMRDKAARALPTDEVSR